MPPITAVNRGTSVSYRAFEGHTLPEILRLARIFKHDPEARAQMIRTLHSETDPRCYHNSDSPDIMDAVNYLVNVKGMTRKQVMAEVKSTSAAGRLFDMRKLPHPESGGHRPDTTRSDYEYPGGIKGVLKQLLKAPLLLGAVGGGVNPNQIPPATALHYLKDNKDLLSTAFKPIGEHANKRILSDAELTRKALGLYGTAGLASTGAAAYGGYKLLSKDQIKRAQAADDNDRTWKPELIAAGAGAALPAASFGQYMSTDVPKIREIMEKTPIRTPGKFGKGLRAGDVLFEGGTPAFGESKWISSAARGVQGSAFYHGIAAGPGGRLYHGGFGGTTEKPLGGSLLGRLMELTEANHNKFKDDKAGLLEHIRKGGLRKDLRKLERTDKVYAKELRQARSNPMFWEDFKQQYASKFKDYAEPETFYVQMRRKGGRPLTSAELSEAAKVRKRLATVPYSVPSAVVSGTLDLAAPKTLRNSIARLFNPGGKACGLGSSMCGELPAGVLQAQGAWKDPVRGALPIHMLSSPEVEAQAMTYVGSKKTTSEIRELLKAELVRGIKTRGALGAAMALTLGGGAAGLISLRRLRDANNTTETEA